MYEFLLLLLPVAAASGWWAAQRSARKEKELCADRDPAYFRGLNYLLNEQPDKAIDVFIKLLEVDSETVETHLALGNLFRRRGEVDRAIRIHQNLIARPTLSREQRALALLELGQDYMRAGLFDRAESLFNELVEMGLHREKALSNLREIYQQEKDWGRCLDVVRKLENVSGQGHSTEIAQYYCEQSEEALDAGDAAAAASLIKKALGVDRRCVRATMLQAELDSARKDLRAAIRSYKQIADQDADFLPEMLPRLVDCYRQLGTQDELLEYLAELYRNQKDTRVMLAYADTLQAVSGERSAQALVSSHLQHHADLLGLERLVDLKRKAADVGPHQETLDILHQLVARLLERQSAYQCLRCGFSARRLHWQCPGCKGWGTVRPLPADGMDPPQAVH
jgi:lipopolysaccharide biosynthesis regulator YciM